MKNIKLAIIGFVIGAIVFGGISFVVATGITSGEIAYTQNNQTTIESALDDLYTSSMNVKTQYNTCTGNLSIAQSNYSTCQTSLATLNASAPSVCYNGTCGKLTYKYWNDGYRGHIYQVNAMPATVYPSRAELETAYGASNFADEPVYIRSVLIDNNVVGHEACLWNNNKEFCITPNYWGGTIGTSDATVGTNTKIKLQRDMQNALSLESTDINCLSSASDAYCYVGVFRCYAFSNGRVYCYSAITNVYCDVNAGGSAHCE